MPETTLAPSPPPPTLTPAQGVAPGAGTTLRKVDRRLLEELTTACHILYLEGQNDLNHGQASARVAGEERFWLRGAALGFEEVGPEDFVLVDGEGRRCHGHRAVPPEWPIHTEIYAARPEVNAVVHTHAPAAILWSSLGRELLPLSHDGCPFSGRLGLFTETTNTILTREMAAKMVEVLGEGPAVLLKNHGLVAVGGNLKEATVMALMLEKACALQLRLPPEALLGEAASASPPEDVAEKNHFIFSHLAVSTYWSYYTRKLDRVRRGEQLPELRQI